jgi:protein-tyrosine phosphatase
MPKNVLFLCTGNYYRSRFAELYFNAQAEASGLDWRARSCGLATELGISNVGAISHYALEGLVRHGVTVPDEVSFPRQVQEADLAAADLIIAVKNAEHRPLLAARYPDWTDRVVYWHIHDLDLSPADEALSEIAAEVRRLISQLFTKN